MVALRQRYRLTVDEYLTMERHSEDKHEYIDGVVYAMAGGTKAHGRLAANLTAILSNHLLGGRCRVYTSDVRVRLTPTQYVYPDLSVSCDERDTSDDETDELCYPCLIVEVLSRSTETYDRTDKFDLYRTCASLQDYVLVNAQRRSVHVYSRAADDTWIVHPFGRDNAVVLASVGLQVSITEIYQAVSLQRDDTELD